MSECFVVAIERAESSDSEEWGFVIFPADVSGILPRRGRVSAQISLNGYKFIALLEPDGKKSHWLRLSKEILNAAQVVFNSEVAISVSAVEQEPEPVVPDDVWQALEGTSDALKTWQQTTAIARLDWIHWIVSAKQDKTRSKRISDMCNMLEEGKKRVCCFDTSGFYSKAFKAPVARKGN
ncbi:MAG: YdeI/OmpD-associated family protein [Thalassolituus sp.]